MSFNKSRRKLAGLLSLLTVAGTTLAGRNFMVSAAVANEYFNTTEGSDLEKDLVGTTAAEKYLILNPDHRARWQKNIADSDKLPNNATGNKCGKDNSFLNVIDGAEQQVFGNKKAGELFAALKNAMKKQNISERFTMMVNIQARDVQSQLNYDPKKGKVTLTADMSYPLAGDRSSVKDKVVYFHYGKKVYATTADILFRAQALTGEIIECTGDDADYCALAKECPLSAAMLVGVANKNDGGEKNGIAEVAWMEYVYPGDKKLSGSYQLKPSQEAVEAKGEYIDEMGTHHDAVDGKELEYTFGDVKTKPLLKDIATTGKEDIQGNLGMDGGSILIKKDGGSYKLKVIANNNAYKSSFIVTRKINRTFSSLEKAKIWLADNKEKLLWGTSGLLIGGGLSAVITALVLGQNSFNFSANDNNDNDEENDNNGEVGDGEWYQ